VVTKCDAYRSCFDKSEHRHFARAAEETQSDRIERAGARLINLHVVI
jgi:hypothetical protein